METTSFSLPLGKKTLKTFPNNGKSPEWKLYISAEELEALQIELFLP
jgi:hypothetical protein